MDEIKTDVLVVGAGPSGLAAAIGAARAGVKVTLVEEDAVVGGAAVDYGVQSFCGGPICGVHRELRERLEELDPNFKETGCFHSQWLVQAAEEMIRDEPNLTLLTYTPVLRAIFDFTPDKTRLVKGAVVNSMTWKKTSETNVIADVVVDCSGDGDIAASAGCELRFGRESKSEFGEENAVDLEDNKVQQLTWMYTSQRVDTESKYKPKGRAMGNGEYLHWGCAIECSDPTNPEKLLEAQRQALKDMEKDFCELRENGFRVNSLAPKIGVRESRRIIGDYILTETDIQRGRKFEDAVVSARYSIDSWEPDREKVFYSVPSYQIPYRCLVPKGVDGLLVAGRCISATHIAMSSPRVMPIASNIGQAAGVAAALSSQKGILPRKLDVTDLRRVLMAPEQGLIV